MEEQIDEIMDYFNFSIVAKVMAALNWEWAGIGVPKEPEIRKFARRLLRDLLTPNTYEVSSGGFKASKQDNCFKLEFIIEEYEVL